jgi:hypothetical protein
MVHKRKVWNSSWLDPTGRDPTSQLKDGVCEHRVYCNNTEGILTVMVSVIPVITSFDVKVRMYQENFIISHHILNYLTVTTFFIDLS